jgi:hypothetical protein
LDSVGALQERSHYGSVARRLNVKLASRRFLQEARALRKSGQFGNAGELAAAVQRPREDLRGRYHEERGAALEVVNRYGGLRPGSSRSSGGGSLGGQRADGPLPGGVSAFSPGDPAAANMSLGAAAPAPIASAPVAEPEFTARPVMPEGFRAAPSIGGPVPPDTTVMPGGTQGLVEDFSAPQGGRKIGPGGKPGKVSVGGGEGLMPARQLMKGLIDAHGLPVTARDEPGHTAGGHHDPARRDATAWDIGGDEPTRKRAFRDLTRALGVKGAKYKGADINVTVDGLRYQIISRDHGSGPHLHVGVELAG